MKSKVAITIISLACVAVAQAQSNVVLYGVADANYRIDHSAIGTLKSVGSGGESGSRWGIRGTEDMGGGLTALFNFEQGIDITDNSVPQGNVTPTTPTSPNSSSGGRLFSRRAVVGINSATFGEFRIGRDYTPAALTWAAIDAFRVGYLGDALSYAVGQQLRYDNAFYYDSPRLFGLQFNGAYRLGESTTDSVASGATKHGGNAGSIGFNYANGPILVGYGLLVTRSALDNNTTREQVAGGVYDFNLFKLHVLYFRNKNDADTTNARSYSLAVTVPFGAWTFNAVAARIDNRVDNGAVNNNPKNNDANFFGLGANYSFSKRTIVYAAAATFRNQAGATFLPFDASGSGLLTASNVPGGFNATSYQLGMRHSF
jgi:predicted porin